MPFANINGERLFYTDEGSGTPLLLVHGFTCDSQDWMYQQPAFAGKYRVIAVDLRGHGHSSAPETGYTPGQFASDLAELCQSLDTGPVVVMGHSLGGAAGVALAVTHPALVRALVQVDAAYGGDDPDEVFEGLVAALAGEDGHAVACGMFAGFYHDGSPPHLRTWHARRIQAVPPHVLAKAIHGLTLDEDAFYARAKSEACLQRVACPALIFRAGKEDPASVARWEREQFSHPYSEAVAWEGAGHFLHQERPAEFNEIVVRWIDGLPGE